MPLYPSHSTEAPCVIKTPIKDSEAPEKGSITFTLEISKPRKVTWYQNGEEITVSERFKMGSDDTGLTLTLTIVDLTLGENAEFTVTVDDMEYGIISCSANLTIKGAISF